MMVGRKKLRIIIMIRVSNQSVDCEDNILDREIDPA